MTSHILKGTAYIIHDLPISHGRIFSDIDILLPKQTLANFEIKLLIKGWLKTTTDDYDDLYYRQWMHELPPFKHSQRETVVDVHHNILPLTNKNCPKSADFSYQTVNSGLLSNIKTLSDEDMLIHSSAHLFSESEYQNGLRDLSDLDMLIRYFSNTDNQFLNKAIKRANELNLANYLWHTLRYTSIIFDTPTLTEPQEKLQQNPKNKLQILVSDFCFKQIFQPDHISCRTWKRTLAAFILYWRGHMLRMPLKLLIPHLCKKTWMQCLDAFKKDESQPQNLN